MKAKTKGVQYLDVGKNRLVVLDEAEYLRLATQAGEWEPSLPAPDEEGNYPADETLAVLTARDIIRRRRAAGLPQHELAKRAGVRLETLQRIEAGKHSPSVAAVEKIDRALAVVEQKKRSKA